MSNFNYEPIATEEEAQKAREFPMLPEGIYDFAVMESKFGYSGAGNPKIDLKLRIIHEGKEFNVYDTLVGTKNMIWKTKHFCESSGLEADYLAGTFDEHKPLNRRGTCCIIVSQARPKNDGSGGMYKARNEVQDYVNPTAAVANPNPFAPAATAAPVAPPARPEEAPFVDSDIPF